MPESPPTNGNAAASKLAALKDLNWPTMILILFTGGTNFFTSQKNNTEREYQVDQAVRQIRELHESLENFEKRSKQSLDNTTQLLEHDSEILREVHKITLNLDNWHRNEQMRGAPQ
jgi:hypothetical protein